MYVNKRMKFTWRFLLNRYVDMECIDVIGDYLIIVIKSNGKGVKKEIYRKVGCQGYTDK